MPSNKHMKEVIKFTDKELNESVNNLRTEVAELQRNIAMGNTTNYKLVGMKKKSIARSMTRLAALKNEKGEK